MTERPIDEDLAEQLRADWEGMAPSPEEQIEDKELTEQMEEAFYNGSTPG